MFRCVPLAFGLVGPGIYMRPTKGRAYFFRTRNTEELVGVLGGWRGGSVSPAALKRKPSKVVRDPFQEAQDTSNWIASIAPDTTPEGGAPPASNTPEPLPEIEEPSASMAPDPLPEIEEPSASIAPDPLPEIEEPAETMASMLLGPRPKDGEAPASIDSMAPDPIPEDEGGEIDDNNDGMAEGDIKQLLGTSYDPDADDTF